LFSFLYISKNNKSNILIYITTITNGITAIGVEPIILTAGLNELIYYIKKSSNCKIMIIYKISVNKKAN